MKTSERHHLKDNELALALSHANEWAGQNQRSITLVVGGIAVLAVAIGGYFVWRNSVDSSARTMLAQALVVSEARVMPPQPPITPVTSGNITPAAPAAAVQPPGTYPTEQAKLEAALPKLLAAADAYPRTDPGRTARYQAAATLVELKRFDDAIAQYDRVAADASGLLAQTAQLGKAEAQLRAGRYDLAIASFKQLSDRTDLNVPKEAMLLELARAYRLSGKNEDAKKTLNQIVEQHADSPFVTEAKQELEKLQG
jgi:tetratricopeptide (TPR) repeat protein